MSVIKGKKQQIKKEIVTLLTQSTIGLTQYQISEQLKVARQTVKKYLDELKNEEKIQSSAIGAYTLYYLPKISDYSFYQVLYYGALRVSAYLTSLRDWLNPELIEIAWGGIIDQIPLPFEELVFLDVDHHKKIAGWTFIFSRLSLSLEPQLRSCVHPGRYP